MRDLEAGLAEDGIAIEHNIQIQRPRPVARGCRSISPELLLDREKSIQQRTRLEFRLEFHDRIHEARLFRDPDRLRRVKTRPPRDSSQPRQSLGCPGERRFRHSSAAWQVSAHPDVSQRHRFQLSAVSLPRPRLCRRVGFW